MDMSNIKNSNIKALSLNGTKQIIRMIGVGASAGGLEPFQKLVANLPGNLSGTTIILADHMSPNYISMLVELLQKKTNLKISEAVNGESLLPNRIYITPPDCDITIQDNTIYLHKSNNEIRSAVYESGQQHDLMRQSENGFSRLLNMLDLTNRIGKIGGWELDLNTQELYWSDEVYHIHELPLDHVLDLEEAFSFYPEENRKSLKKELDECAETGKSAHMELPLITANGKKIWVRVMAEAINEKGKITKLRGIIQNINERKIFEKNLIAAKCQAEKLNKTKTAFLSNVSHEIRTPLNGVLGISQLLKLESKETHTLKYADLIMESGERLLHTIDELLDLSKAESGRVRLKIRPHNINDTINLIVNNLKPIARKKSIYLTTEFHKEQIIALIDEQALYHILMNLIGNALKFTETGGVTIKSSYRYHAKKKTVAKATIEISDTGPGISKSFLKKIFQPFTREKDNDGNGTGLGMSITKSYVDKLKGNIEVSSEVGKGTAFKLSFPA